MAEFPLLKTGAIAQFPLGRVLSTVTETVSFLDGSRQSYRLRGSALRRWLVRLDQLDAEELSTLIDFAEVQGTDEFTFGDPVTGETVARCVITETGIAGGMTGEASGHVSIVIEELA